MLYTVAQACSLLLLLARLDVPLQISLGDLHRGEGDASLQLFVVCRRETKGLKSCSTSSLLLVFPTCATAAASPS